MPRYQLTLRDEERDALDTAAEVSGDDNGAQHLRRVVRAYLRNPEVFKTVIGRQVAKALSQQQPAQSPVLSQSQAR